MHFIGEDGIDAGGVKKEFFQLLITELLCPDYGMLVFQPVRGVLVDTSVADWKVFRWCMCYGMLVFQPVRAVLVDASVGD